MATYQVLYWHDIPVQVKASEGRNRHSQPLAGRFMEAVDAAAMAAGLVGSDAYMDQFHWADSQTRDGSPEAVAAAIAAELEAQYPSIDWKATVGGLKIGHSVRIGSVDSFCRAILDSLQADRPFLASVSSSA